jgi:hypothetical protein
MAWDTRPIPRVCVALGHGSGKDHIHLCLVRDQGTEPKRRRVQEVLAMEAKNISG